MTRNPTRTNAKTQGTDQRTTRTTAATTRAGPRRAAVLVLGLLLFTVALAPAASADTSSKIVCLGDTDHTGERPAEAGTGCAEGWIHTRDSCTTQADNTRDCTIEGRLKVTVRGAQSCGSSSSSWFTNMAAACVNLDQTIEGEDSHVTNWETIATIENVPPKGMTVEIPAETCAWTDRTDVALTSCDPYTHEHRIDAISDAGGLELVDGLVEHATTTVNNAEAPVTVTP